MTISNIAQLFWQTCQKHLTMYITSYFPANIRLDEDVLKTSWKRLSSSSLEDVFKTSSRLLDQDEYVRLSLTSSEDVWVKTNIFVLAIRLQDVFKTSCRNVFKTSSRRLQDVGLNACDFDQKALKLIHSYECDMSQKLKVGFSFSNGILCNLP